MYVFIILMLMGVRESGTATLSFVFPNSGMEEVVQMVEEVNEPLVRVAGVAENNDVLEIDLVSREELEFSFDVHYDDGSIESYGFDFIDGSKKLKVPIVLSGSRSEIRWVNILWEGDGLMVCNAAHENLPDLSLVSGEEFEKN